MNKEYQTVGGIVYKLLQNPKANNTTDVIDLSSFPTMAHRPIKVEDTKIDGYTPQYQFRTETNTPTEERPIAVEKPISVPTPRFKIIQASNPRTPEKRIDLNINESLNDNERLWTDTWNQFGSKLGLKDNKAYLYLLGQIKHESGDFQYMQEIADGSAYEGREDLGNVNKGDGKKYKGRGPLQVTGRSNYEKIYNEFFVPNGLSEYDIVNNPELANDPKIGSLLSMGWFAVTDQGKQAIASANNYDIKGVTKAINGGYNGLQDRIKRTNDLLKQYS